MTPEEAKAMFEKRTAERSKKDLRLEGALPNASPAVGPDAKPGVMDRIEKEMFDKKPIADAVNKYNPLNPIGMMANNEAALQGFGQGASGGFLPWLQAQAEQGMRGVGKVFDGEFASGAGDIARTVAATTPLQHVAQFIPNTKEFNVSRDQWATRDDNLRKDNPLAYGTGALTGAMMMPSPLGKAGVAGLPANASRLAKMGRFGLEGLVTGAQLGAGESVSRGADAATTVKNILGGAGAAAATSAVAGPSMQRGFEKVAPYVMKAGEKMKTWVDPLMNNSYEHTFKAATEPYFSDSKELLNATKRKLEDTEGIPSQQMSRIFGKYIQEEGLAPRWFSSADKTAPVFAQRRDASGALMGEANDVGQEFLESFGIKGVPSDVVRQRIAEQIPGLKRTGKLSEADAALGALGRVDRIGATTHTLPELQSIGTNAMSEVNFASPDIMDKAAFIHGANTKEALRDTLRLISDPSFRDAASKARWPAGTARPAQPQAAVRVTPAGVVDAEFKALPQPKEFDDSALSPELYRQLFGEQPRLPLTSSRRNWRFPVEYSATGPGLEAGTLSGGFNATSDAGRAAFQAQRGAAGAQREFVGGLKSRVETPQLPPGPDAFRALPGSGEAVPQGAYRDVSGLFDQYEQGRQGYAMNAALADLAGKGVDRRWFNRAMTPTAKGAGVGGMVAGATVAGPAGMLAGPVVGGLAATAQRAYDPVMARGSKWMAENMAEYGPAMIRRGEQISNNAPEIARRSVEPINELMMLLHGGAEKPVTPAAPPGTPKEEKDKVATAHATRGM